MKMLMFFGPHAIYPERLCREESEHRSAVRQLPAFHTLATLCQLASVAGVGGHPSPVEVLRDSTLAPLKSFQAQERPEKGAKSKGRAFRQVTLAFNLRCCPSCAPIPRIYLCIIMVANDSSFLPLLRIEMAVGCRARVFLRRMGVCGGSNSQCCRSPRFVFCTAVVLFLMVGVQHGLLCSIDAVNPC